MTDTYRIKPLQWEHYERDGYQTWHANSVFCELHVDLEPDGHCYWRYCIDEYYDEGQHDCESPEAGKAAAEKFYLDRLLPALEQIA